VRSRTGTWESGGREFSALPRGLYEASKEPGVALARRSLEYLEEKLRSGKAVLCLADDRQVPGN
jgi:hypothetical protein